jgi:glycosyltransferase involved in cell wall biosynthesis
VHWLGQLADTAPLLPQLDALVAPSVAAEAAPRTIAEAQAAGCAVVASAVGGVGELVRDGNTGVLVPPGDAAALQRALETLLADAAGRRELVANARRQAEQQYTMAAFVRRCESVFARVAGP